MLNKTRKALLWSGIQQISGTGIQFLITIIIARLLTPEDYGLVAVLGIFIALSKAIIECGIGSSLIQKENVNKEDYNTALVFSVITSIWVYVTLYFCSPIISEYFNHPELILLLRVYAFILVINSFGIVPYAILQRAMHFKSIAIITTMTSILSGIMAIILAYNGWAYWALVSQYLISAICMVIVYYVYSHWTPSIQFSWESLSYMLSYGVPVLFTSVVFAIYNNFYSFIIGARYSSAELGLFNRAQSYGSFISTNFSAFSMRALFPVLSRSQSSMPEFQERSLNTLRHSLFVIIPIVFFISFNSSDLVFLLLGPKWVDISLFIKILSIASLSYVFTNLHFNGLKAIGKTKLLLLSEISKKSLGIICLLVAVQYGVLAVAWGLLLLSAVEIILSSAFFYIATKITIYQQLLVTFQAIIFSLLSGFLCLFIQNQIEHGLLRLLVCILTFGSCYICLSFLFGNRSLRLYLNYFR